MRLCFLNILVWLFSLKPLLPTKIHAPLQKNAKTPSNTKNQTNQLDSWTENEDAWKSTLSCYPEQEKKV